MFDSCRGHSARCAETGVPVESEGTRTPPTPLTSRPLRTGAAGRGSRCRTRKSSGALPRSGHESAAPRRGSRPRKDPRRAVLLSNSLRRRAHALGLKLRHSDLGYSLVDLDGNRVDERNDLTLAEIGAVLDSRPETAQRGARKRG